MKKHFIFISKIKTLLHIHGGGRTIKISDKENNKTNADLNNK